MFGLTRNIITQSQYTILVTTLILSAVVPTLIAQAFFLPELARRLAKLESGTLSKEAEADVP